MGSGLLGIVSSLVGNIAHAKKQEQAEDDAYWQRMSLVMGAVMDNPSMPLPVQDQARQFYYDTLTKHAGKEGKEQAEQMNEFLKKALPVRKAVQKRQQEDATTQAMGAPAGPAALTGGADRQGQTPQNTPYLPAFAGAPPTPQPAPGPAPPAPPPSADAGPSGPTYANAAGYLGAYPGGGQRRGGLMGALAGIGGGVQEALTGMPARHTPLPPGAAATTTDPTLRRYMAEQQLQQLQRQRDIQQRFQSGVAGGLKGRDLYEWAYANKWPTQQRPSTAAPKTIPVLVDGKPATVREVTQSDGTVKYFNAQNQEIDASKVSYAPPKEAVGAKYPAALQTRIDIDKIKNAPAGSLGPDEQSLRQAAKEMSDSLANQAKSQNALAVQRERQNQLGQPIVPGSAEFTIAQQLAYGQLTLSQMTKLYSYSRDPTIRANIVNTALKLNPNLNLAMLESDYKFASTPRIRQQISALDNVQMATADMIRLSNEAKRSGVTVLNRLENPLGFEIGDKHVSSFLAARKLYADELSGALGFGSASDMKLQLGFDVMDPNLSPENFAYNIETAVNPFVDRKRNSMLMQMGPYGEEERKRADAIKQGAGDTSTSGAPGGGAAGPAARPAMGGYVIGQKYGGLTYLGGDPKDRASWK